MTAELNRYTLADGQTGRVGSWPGNLSIMLLVSEEEVLPSVEKLIADEINGFMVLDRSLIAVHNDVPVKKRRF